MLHKSLRSLFFLSHSFAKMLTKQCEKRLGSVLAAHGQVQPDVTSIRVLFSKALARNPLQTMIVYSFPNLKLVVDPVFNIIVLATT